MAMYPWEKAILSGIEIQLDMTTTIWLVSTIFPAK
jgi:hypothetical protein